MCLKLCYDVCDEEEEEDNGDYTSHFIAYTQEHSRSLRYPLNNDGWKATFLMGR